MPRSGGGLLLILVWVLLGFALGAAGLITTLGLLSPHVHDSACEKRPGEKFSANAVCT